MQRRRRNSAEKACAAAVAAALLASLPLRAEPVVLILKNGDRISGELTAEDDSKVTVRSPVVGKLRIAKSEISKRERPLAPAPVATPPSAAVPPVAAVKTTPPATARKPGAPVAPAPVPTGELPGGLARYVPEWTRPFLTNWHGNVQLGMDVGFGTTDRKTFYINGSASHAWNRVRNLADFHVAYGSLNAVQSANRMDGSMKTDLDLSRSRRLYVYNQGGTGYDEIRHVSLEFHEGAGLGYKILQRPKLIINGETGMQYEHQTYLNAPQRSFVSLRLGENMTWKISDKLSVTQRLAYTPDIADFGEFRVRFDLGVGYPLFKRVTLNLNVIEQYDAKPPLGVDKNDLQVQSTLGITF